MTTGAVQTTIQNAPSLAVAGMLYDSGPKDAVSIIASQDIPFGSYVKIAGEYGSLPASSADVTNFPGGIALTDPSAEPTGVGYKQGDVMAVLIYGRVWALFEQAVANGVQPFVRFTVNAALTPGSLRNDADTSKAVQRPGIVMFTASAAGGGTLGVLQVNTVGR